MEIKFKIQPAVSVAVSIASSLEAGCRGLCVLSLFLNIFFLFFSLLISRPQSFGRTDGGGGGSREEGRKMDRKVSFKEEGNLSHLSQREQEVEKFYFALHMHFLAIFTSHQPCLELGLSHLHTFFGAQVLKLLGAQVGALFINFGCTSS